MRRAPTTRNPGAASVCAAHVSAVRSFVPFYHLSFPFCCHTAPVPSWGRGDVGRRDISCSSLGFSELSFLTAVRVGPLMYSVVGSKCAVGPHHPLTWPFAPPFF
ncbi:hypothetical protein HPP92_009323 [Vanilla planifolia]|uniref:Uncharacterized protein n=1 Tax=Vanilla planifolia TaxID=51239 RepID=A0A835RBB5_VANPL|nr:hypothetical protein HPP92_009323 [Vanilla planifolia]